MNVTENIPTMKDYQKIQRERDLQKEYPVLYTSVAIFRIIAFALIILPFLALLYFISQEIEFYGIIAMLLYYLTALIFALLFFSSAEIIKLFIRIELNTRKD